jgi:ABC-2 type transport system ATP-binding protein
MKIEFKNISKRYKNKYALKEFSFVIENGVYGILGTNGAGKTTLLNIFMGIIKSDSGIILIDGVDVKKMGTDFLSQIGYLPQSTQFYKNFTVHEFLKYMCVLKGIAKEEGHRRIDELLPLVNLDHDRQKKIGALSGGMKQRLGIAQAMLGYPSILVLDEPTAGLDPQERIRFRNLISKFAENRIVLVATHIVPDIEFIANEVIILKDGLLLKQGRIDTITKELYGKVWSMVLDDQHLLQEMDRYQVSNMMRDGDALHLRIVGDERPAAYAENVDANLEDVFLYYCGEDKND